MLEMAILGLLLESPMHGYELRKRLTGLLGAFRAFSYGSLYPTLRRMQADGLIDETSAPSGVKVRRGRRVYQLTDAGRERFTELVADTGPQNYTDDGFGVHLAFFSRTPAIARMRILEGRRRQVEERREGLRELVGRATGASDRYTRQMHELSLESSEREVRWLNELIAAEASEASSSAASSSAASASAPTDFPATTSPTSGTSPTTGAEEQEETEQDEPLGRTPVSQPSAAARQEKGEPDHG
ncbi:helix-turn-helix transcriptional regulator [Gordonia polyisoprenivorans]|uniref:PadR family transcriptional regulator n=1 Tax=Gordonia polyisoprenivorans TaxID=84595 RepID=UPI001B8B6CBA|nr:PadR family transcriptional regulator [Gordonia polyisoprenivorans]QUD82821.1 helix-turn-helix transcriptional regulator [Gordonia polyisoprenivorans]WCB37406.1 PadR family transcriptional regulator [Gordonia polyisoprenivorans]